MTDELQPCDFHGTTPDPCCPGCGLPAMDSCPFCGSGNIDPEGWMAEDAEGIRTTGPTCDDCGASAQSVTAWNTRPARDEGRRGVVGGELPLPCYIVSEPHLSGYRVVLGYETLTESMDAQDAFSRLARGLVRSLVPTLLRGGDHPDGVASGPLGTEPSVAAAPSPPVADKVGEQARISDEAVEAAARAINADRWRAHMDVARAALEAAMPHLLASLRGGVTHD